MNEDHRPFAEEENCWSADALADQPGATCNLIPHDSDLEYRTMRNSIYSFAESEQEDPYDLVPFIDQVSTPKFTFHLPLKTDPGYTARRL